MSRNLGCRNVVIKVAALLLASAIINSNCWAMVTTPEEKEDLELWSSRDELVQMAGYGEEKLSTVLITGTLLCYQACYASPWMPRELFPRSISGALVGAICSNDENTEERASLTKVVSDEYGEFIIDLPSELHGITRLDKACSVRILQVPKDSPCYESSYARKLTKTNLSSIGNGIRTYTTGTIAVISDVSRISDACSKGLEAQQPEQVMVQ